MSRSITPELNPSQMAEGLVRKQSFDRAVVIAKDMAAINGTDRESTKTQNFWKAVSSKLAKLGQARSAKKESND